MEQIQNPSRLLPNWWRILNALRQGAALQIDDATFELIETEEGDTVLAYPTTGGDQYVESHITVIYSRR